MLIKLVEGDMIAREVQKYDCQADCQNTVN